MRPLSGLLEIAVGPDHWIGAIERALAGRSAGSAHLRKQRAQMEDWNARTDVLESWLRDLLRQPSVQVAEIPAEALSGAG